MRAHIRVTLAITSARYRHSVATRHRNRSYEAVSGAGSVKLVIVGLRPRQNIKRKQQPEHPEEYETNVC
jgi:hypothetical protein